MQSTTHAEDGFAAKGTNGMATYGLRASRAPCAYGVDVGKGHLVFQVWMYVASVGTGSLSGEEAFT